MHFNCWMTPKTIVKILKLLQVQASIYSTFVLQGVVKARYWLVNYWKSGPICKLSSNFGTNFQSFDNVKKAVTDPLSEAETSNFSFTCFLVEPYVKKIEAGKPMVPFIYTELKSLLRYLLPSTLWSLMFLINVRLVYKWLQLIWIWNKILCLLMMSNKVLG